MQTNLNWNKNRKKWAKTIFFVFLNAFKLWENNKAKIPQQKFEVHCVFP